ncbi:ABC transporter permease [Paenibacillus thalictri]|uniref:ABC transporter permease n=1 Tax=Paenibacillus thalictri TaxID=2527873 RepID=A0A4V2J2Z3_9BACL|nr:ABC transporter permease [Paenibacillus thalictri]TBL68207.1 ABC transporter permease [Paenibacillus thalictri]
MHDGLKLAVKRLAVGLSILLLVSSLLFFVSHAMGDPVRTLLPPDATEAERETMRHALGLDAPAIVRFGLYMLRTITLQFGNSYKLGEPVLTIALPYLWATTKLIALVLPIGIVGGIGLGFLGSYLPRKADKQLTKVLLMLHSIPGFVPCILAIELFCVHLKWFPPSGSQGIRSLVLPVLLLAAAEAIKISLLFRSKLQEVAKEKYIVTAKAKSVSEFRFRSQYLLRPALSLIFSFVSVQVGVLLSSTIVVEAIFSYPGIGNLTVSSIASHDLPLIQACLIFTTLLFIVSRFVLDLIHPLIDPRVKQKQLGETNQW